jgi:imidazole glycerol-phosphate synthase subunit HisH
MLLSIRKKSSDLIVIVDYGTGNLVSVKRALERIDVKSVFSSTAADVLRADKIILPGVGHFGMAMAELEKLGLRGALDEAVLGARKPVLGICLGMELMAHRSEEGGAEGLGWINAEVVKFNFSDKRRYKSPHMGWNRTFVKKRSGLMRGVNNSAEFYFAHSYYLNVQHSSDTLCETKYETLFTSAIEKDNIFGVQFHPEKSHDPGRRVLLNFVEM